MTTSTHHDLHVLDIGPPAWCWSRLTSTSDATLSFATTQGRFAVPVRYSVGHEQITVAVPSLDSLAWSAAGRVATLKITGSTPDQLRWSVRATGEAYRAGDHLRGAPDDHDHDHDRRRGSGRAGPAWLVLAALQVRGHYETVMLDGGPAGRHCS